MKLFTIKNKKHINILLILLAIIAGLLILLVLKHIFFNKIKIIEANTAALNTAAASNADAASNIAASNIAASNTATAASNTATAASNNSTLEQTIIKLWDLLKNITSEDGGSTTDDSAAASAAATSPAARAAATSPAARAAAAAAATSPAARAAAAAAAGAAGNAAAKAAAAKSSMSTNITPVTATAIEKTLAHTNKNPSLTIAQQVADFIQIYTNETGLAPSEKQIQEYKNEVEYNKCLEKPMVKHIGFQCSNKNKFISVPGNKTPLSQEEKSNVDLKRSKVLDLVSSFMP